MGHSDDKVNCSPDFSHLPIKTPEYQWERIELPQTPPQPCPPKPHIFLVKTSVAFTVPLALEGAVEVLEWTWVEFTVDETVDVMVCMMHNPGEFYCHCLKDDGKLALRHEFWRVYGCLVAQVLFVSRQARKDSMARSLCYSVLWPFWISWHVANITVEN